jgi:Fe2+ transport system protein B
MDPITLFALANGAVSAVKAGCKLYKDIKGAAGEVKEVLKDLDNQFHNVYAAKGKTPPPAAIKQLNEEKTRVKELNKREGEVTNIYSEIGEQLGAYYDNFNKCIAIFEEEERKAKREVYKGNASLGKRALQRVLMKKQLEQMSIELRELMIYQSPPELGALYTEVEEMMGTMGKEQKALIAAEMRKHEIDERRRKARQQKLIEQAIVGIAIMFIVIVFMFTMMWVAYDRQQKYPQYGNELFPKTEEQRREESQPKKYIGR